MGAEHYAGTKCLVRAELDGVLLIDGFVEDGEGIVDIGAQGNGKIERFGYHPAVPYGQAKPGRVGHRIAKSPPFGPEGGIIEIIGTEGDCVAVQAIGYA